MFEGRLLAMINQIPRTTRRMCDACVCVCNAHVVWETAVCVLVCVMCVLLTSASWQANTAYWKMIACFWAQQSDRQSGCESSRERGSGAGFADYLFARTLMIYAPTFHLLHIIRGKPATVPRPTHSRPPLSVCLMTGRGRGKLASFI